MLLGYSLCLWGNHVQSAVDFYAVWVVLMKSLRPPDDRYHLGFVLLFQRRHTELGITI